MILAFPGGAWVGSPESLDHPLKTAELHEKKEESFATEERLQQSLEYKISMPKTNIPSTCLCANSDLKSVIKIKIAVRTATKFLSGRRISKEDFYGRKINLYWRIKEAILIRRHSIFLGWGNLALERRQGFSKSVNSIGLHSDFQLEGLRNWHVPQNVCGRKRCANAK
jgi:hypothetical protein